jgi:hypothetical protein
MQSFVNITVSPSCIQGDSEMQTLRELAILANRVADATEHIEETVQNAEQFSELQDDINHLQVAAPKSEAVVMARVCWFRHGLGSFERHFLHPTVEHVEGWEDWNQYEVSSWHPVPGLIMHWVTLTFFLNRHYLGNKAFVELYPKVVEMLEQLVAATEGTKQHKDWQERLDSLWKDLFEGRR